MGAQPSRSKIKVAARLIGVTGLRGAYHVQRLARNRDVGGAPRVVRVHALGDAPVQLRAGTTDAMVFIETFVGLEHSPPPEVAAARIVWDLGANIGLTVAHYAAMFPCAAVRAVELHPETARAAEVNVAPWSDRCTLSVGAVWIEDGEITYEFEKGQEYAARLQETGTHGTGGRRAPSFSLNTLTAGDLVIDFLKMDIEGAEQAVLRRNTEWAERVRAIKVATHPPYSLEECAEDLRALGFETRLDYGNWGSSVIGVRL